ncbi:hypothetical protein [Halorubrum ezzemoulense]|uniref:C2H2-type domain-containing protein n=1 Tax=Halorubrum ezzemoulense TaxID=337243 RepID=A0A256JSQ8_HALEZ|nr:hypothetical protein [Halorubrum ezzemoulense]OYR71586.1 hypothetical protein DJ78_05065 [Halorubrum ezzemoulense]
MIPAERDETMLECDICGHRAPAPGDMINHLEDDHAAVERLLHRETTVIPEQAASTAHTDD